MRSNTFSPVRSSANTTTKPQLFVGLMSGTSADGIDAVVARLHGLGRKTRARVISHVHRSFSQALRERIHRVSRMGTVAEICELNFVLGKQFGRTAMAAIAKAGLKPTQITAIGSHGQTIHHLPNEKTPSTLQIGEPAVIAEMTGITTVADFRVRDMAAGGQGAPLVTFADWLLFTHSRRPRIVQNIGGIGNLTFLPADSRREQVVAFDTGPGNMVIDGLVSALTGGRLRYDRGGAMAAKGKISEALLSHLMLHPFLRRRPPKTTGREEFGDHFARDLFTRARRLRLSDADILATATEFTAASIADAYRRFIFPQLQPRHRRQLQVILGGGGAKNPVLREALQRRIGIGELLTHEDFGVNNSAKEALAFAILARETLRGRPANVPSATGARGPAILGKIVLGV